MKAKVYETKTKEFDKEGKEIKVRAYLWTSNNLGGTENLVESKEL